MIVKNPASVSLGAPNAAASVGVDDADFAAFSISGTWAGTLTFEATLDNLQWRTAAVVDASLTTSPGLVTTTTANGLFTFTNSSYLAVRAKFTTYTSGVAVVKMTTSRIEK